MRWRGQAAGDLPADLAHFKATTLGKPVVMGRRTFDSIGRALPGRRNVVVTRDRSWSRAGVETAHSIEDALARCAEADEVMAIGGGELFAALLPRASRIVLTVIHTTLEGDTFFPELDPDDWSEVERTERAADDRNTHALSFIELRRRTSLD